jgi:D-3-phosphoglycerate dehydrogenase
MMRVVITDCNFGQGEIEQEVLGDGFEVVVLGDGGRRELLGGVGDADILIVNLALIDDEVLAAAPRLKGIVRYGIGLDNIDLDAAEEVGVEVRNVDDYCMDEVPDHTVAMVLAASRRLWMLDRAVKAGQWGPKLVPAARPPADLVVGIAGFGRIGRGVAERLHRLDFGIAFWDPFDIPCVPDYAASYETLLELAAASDFLALHFPLTASTRSIVDGRILAALGSEGHLINTGRGGLIDERALLDALDGDVIASASLDVLELEPPIGAGTSAALAVHPRVLATPHIAYQSTRSMETLRRHAALRVKEILA